MVRRPPELWKGAPRSRRVTAAWNSRWLCSLALSWKFLSSPSRVESPFQVRHAVRDASAVCWGSSLSVSMPCHLLLEPECVCQARGPDPGAWAAVPYRPSLLAARLCLTPVGEVDSSAQAVATAFLQPVARLRGTSAPVTERSGCPVARWGRRLRWAARLVRLTLWMCRKTRIYHSVSV